MTLTPRESEIASMVAKGLTSSRIASELGVSPRTVEKHIEHAAARLGGDGRPRYVIMMYVLRDEGDS